MVGARRDRDRDPLASAVSCGCRDRTSRYSGHVLQSALSVNCSARLGKRVKGGRDREGLLEAKTVVDGPPGTAHGSRVGSGALAQLGRERGLAAHNNELNKNCHGCWTCCVPQPNGVSRNRKR